MSTHGNIDIEVRDLRALTETEIATLEQLEISDWQEIKGGSFIESLEAWNQGAKNHVPGLCFLIENNPVGMTLFKRPPLSPSWATSNSATIHGLKIAMPWQGKGLGHKSFSLAVEQLKNEWPGATTLMLSVDADNTAAIAIYRAYGMTDSELDHEDHNDTECRLEISLLT